MNSQIVQRLIPAVLGGFLIGSSLIASAGEPAQPGVVRITDSRPKRVPFHNVGYGHKRQGEYHPLPGSVDGSASGVPGGCPHCQGSGCPHCFGGCPTGHCKHGSCYGGYCHLKHCLHGKFQEHYCCHHPDYGFSSPGKFPIYRQSVQYNQYYPNAWYGTPGGGIAAGVVYPTVYMPTDTTQLGFYYQHVPFWMPNPNALPPRPIPAQWHVLNPAPGFGWRGIGWGGGAYPPGDGVMNGTTVMPAPMNGDEPTPITTPAPTVIEPAPVPVQEDLPAPVPDASARNLEIRRANLQN